MTRKVRVGIGALAASLVLAAAAGATPGSAAPSSAPGLIDKPVGHGAIAFLAGPSADYLLQRQSIGMIPEKMPALPAAPADLGSRIRRAASSGKPWDVVVILTDDQPAGTEVGMPTVRREIIDRGITYSNGVIPTSVCCPSRSSFLTGLFANGTGVYDNSNGGAPGGYKAYHDNGNAKKALGYLLHRRGYRTGMFGKFLNAYFTTYNGVGEPGWDAWRVFSKNTAYSHFYVSNPYRGKELKRFKRGATGLRAPEDFVKSYSTTFFGKLTADFIRSTPRKKPLFAMYTPYAPHGPNIPSRKYRNTLTDTDWWRTDPSVMEDDVTDKPRWVAELPVFGRLDGRPLGQRLVRQRETLLSVDDEVRRIVRALRDTGRLSRTLLVFTSDNGYMQGQHRLSRKAVAYKWATDVPLVIRAGDLQTTGVVDARIAAANVDVNATIRAATGLPPSADGVDMFGSVQRTGVPVMGVPNEFDGVARPPYCGWRSARDLYVKYGSGEEEYYDYTADPYELDNGILPDGTVKPPYAARVDEVRDQTRRSCSPPPPGFGTDYDHPEWKYSDNIPKSDRDVEE